MEKEIKDKLVHNSMLNWVQNIGDEQRGAHNSFHRQLPVGTYLSAGFSMREQGKYIRCLQCFLFVIFNHIIIRNSKLCGKNTIVTIHYRQ